MSLFNIVFTPEDEGFTVTVPSLPGCITWAPSIAEGKVLIKEAIEAYRESLEKEGDLVRDDSSSFFSSVYA